MDALFRVLWHFEHANSAYIMPEIVYLVRPDRKFI